MSFLTDENSMIPPPSLLRRTHTAWCNCGIRVSVFNRQRRGGICRDCCSLLRSSFIIKRAIRLYQRRLKIHAIRRISTLVVTSRLNIGIQCGIVNIINKFIV